MGVIIDETEINSSVPPAKFFGAILDGQDLMPKIIPQAIKNIEIIEGDGGVGSIRKIYFGDASPFEFIKETIDVIDKENLTYAYTAIEGGPLAGKFEKLCNEIKIVPTPDGGSIVKISSKFYPLEGVEIKEEEIKAGKEKSLGLFKAFEAYLLANP